MLPPFFLRTITLGLLLSCSCVGPGRADNPDQPKGSESEQAADDAFEDLLRDLENDYEEEAPDKQSDSRPSSTSNADQASDTSAPSDDARQFSIVCEGKVEASGQLLSLPSKSFEFALDIDLDEEIFIVTEVAEGDFYEEDEAYDIEKISRRYLSLEVDYKGKLLDIDTLRIDRRTLGLSAEALLPNGYEPRLLQPKIDLSGECVID